MRREDESRGVFQTPMRTVGAFGQAVLLFLLMYEWPWKDIWDYRSGARFHEWASYFYYVLALLLPAAAIILSGLLFLATNLMTAKTSNSTAFPCSSMSKKIKRAEPFGSALSFQY